MAVYEEFSKVYDRLMTEIPYDEWALGLRKMLEKYGVPDGLVAELGAGTGSMTERLAQAGYDMIGIDSSEEMLQEALAKRDRTGSDILYLCQDMRDFELYGTVRAFVSVCDTMNYLTDTDDLKDVFRLVNNYLDPGGVFIFDLTTEHFFRETLGDRTEADDSGDLTMIWENSYDPEERINAYDVILFRKEEDGRYRKDEEYHEQRAWTVREIREASEEAGMTFTAAVKAYSEEEASEEDDRIIIVLTEKGKRETV